MLKKKWEPRLKLWELRGMMPLVMEFVLMVASGRVPSANDTGSQLKPLLIPRLWVTASWVKLAFYKYITSRNPLKERREKKSSLQNILYIIFH